MQAGQISNYSKNARVGVLTKCHPSFLHFIKYIIIIKLMKMMYAVRVDTSFDLWSSPHLAYIDMREFKTGNGT